jgi:GNAT superfamily N-acetyltransferase
MKVSRVIYDEIKHLKSEVSKDGVSLKDVPDSYYWAAIAESGDIIGIVGAIRNKGSATVRYKAAWVHPEYRKRRIYKILFLRRHRFFREQGGVTKITAFCTDNSLNLYKKLGFKEGNRNRAGNIHVVKEFKKREFK